MCAESTSWEPTNPNFSVNNNSSVVYNIINGSENKYTGLKKIKIFDKKVANKKKGVTEFSDLARSFFPNYNPQYPQFEKDKIFNRYNGLFSQMYNSAWRNGNLVIPFRDKKTELVKEPDYSQSPKQKSRPLHTDMNRSLSPRNGSNSPISNSRIIGVGSGIMNTSNGTPPKYQGVRRKMGRNATRKLSNSPKFK